MGGSSSSPVSSSPVSSSPVSSSTVNYNKVDFLDQDGPVKRVVCRLENLKDVDIIVNSTDRSLDLTSGGEISNTILRVAGSEIQEELKQGYPNGIEPGKIAVTEGYGLPYNSVYHCSLQNISRRISHHLIREVVTECLQTAVRKHRSPPSIAFPAIGTGSMNFPPRILKTIYCAILEFMEENPDTLKLAYVIIYPGKEDLINYAKGIDPDIERERLTYPVTFPTSWSQTELIRRIPLANSDGDYSFVAQTFKDTIGQSHRIIKIERIENKRLYIAYERYRNSLPSNERTPKYLWHGTKQDTIDGIVRYGFDWRLTERAVYGKGCYFAKEASYSNNDRYSEPNDQGEKHMFLANVIVGNAIVGNGNINEGNIPSNEQTTVDSLQNPTIFVTYNDDQVYPAFLVVYKKT